jgi:xylan 1,4-beta-xylosidase
MAKRYNPTLGAWENAVTKVGAPMANISNLGSRNSQNQLYNQSIPPCLTGYADEFGWDGLGSDMVWDKPREATNNIDLDLTRDNDYDVHGTAWVDGEWRRGLEQFIANWRNAINAQISPTAPLWLNSGKPHTEADITGVFANSNGPLWEMAEGHMDFTDEWGAYKEWIEKGRKPSTWVTDVRPLASDPVAAALSNTKNYFRLERMLLAFTLMGDGYFQFNPLEAGEHHWYAYYDEFALKGILGAPTDLGVAGPAGDAQQLANNILVRFFAGGAAIENPNGSPVKVCDSSTGASACSGGGVDIHSAQGYAGPYYRFRGNQDPAQNNGQQFTSMALPGHTYIAQNSNRYVGDGIVLVKQANLAVVTDIYVDNNDHFTTPGSVGAQFTGPWADIQHNWSAFTFDDDRGRGTYALRYLPPNAIGTALYHPTINVPGEYEVWEFHGDMARSGIDVEFNWPQKRLVDDTQTGERSPGPAATAVNYQVIHAGGTTAFTVNQAASTGRWNRLGTGTFRFTGAANQGVRIMSDGDGDIVQADAIRFVCTTCANSAAAASAGDTTYPTIGSFTTSVGSVRGAWSATDDTGLARAELWRALFQAASCNDTVKTNCQWGTVPITTQTVSGATGSGTLIDTLTGLAAGDYWYGVHIIDQAGNCITEGGRSCGGAAPADQAVASRTNYGSKKMAVAAGTAPPQQCGDGIDNDTPPDGKIDMADPGCTSAADNSETDPVAGGAGNLTVNANQVLGPVAPFWKGFGHDPFWQGTISARAKKQFDLFKAATVDGARVITWYRAHNIFSDRGPGNTPDASNGKVYSPDCSDGMDNDSDGFTDREYPETPAKPTGDPQCASILDDSESVDGLQLTPYDFTRVDQVFDYITTNGFKPIVELGFSPQALCKGYPASACMHGDFGLAWTSPPAGPNGNYAEWSNLVKATIQHLRSRYGAAETESWLYEVWNEPNHTEFWVPNAAGANPANDVNEYNKMYDYTHAAVKAVCPNCKVGGPATAGNGSNFTKFWLDHIYASSGNYATGGTGAKADFYSLHSYGRIFPDPAGTPNRQLGALGNVEEFWSMVKGLDRGGSPRDTDTNFINKPLLLDETGPQSHADPDTTPYPIHDQPYSAAWAVQLTDGLYEQADSLGAEYVPDFSFWWGQIGRHALTRKPGGAGGSTQNDTELIKRPSFNALLALSYLKGSRIAVAGATAQNTIHGIAAKDGASRLALVLFNIDSRDVYNANMRVNNVAVAFQGIPFARFSVKKYVIDETRSNAFDDFLAGAPFATLDQRDELELVETAPVQQATGGAWSTTVPMKTNSVTLLLLENSLAP